ncbi:hypothetical protein NHX12_029181 [Muraenolepis orangiensis]|uniref:BTB domain-containing protein n=1 Tax=Muraenolepis orangiensis TaxID=630683 RepID=A0A9Q0EES2_9TELE|nr:hypothetical protein NHX12_029181 [Muraenolepis orangiensis]
MSEGLLQVEIPDFGSSVLGSLNEQRLLGHYCDVSILVQGQSFKAHRAVLAASSLYFRDLFSSAPESSSSQVVFELPSSVTPACFQQILSFCYTGRLSMATSEQLVLMYTAGYLQIQNIVERGMELMMMKASSASSPLCCDSQTASAEELGGYEPALSAEELLLAVSRIKQERADTPPPMDETPGEEPEKRRGDTTRDLQATRGSALCYLGAGGGLVPGLQSYLLATAERSSPAGSSLPTESPPSHPPTEEELEDDYYPPGIYGHIYGHPSNPYIQEKMEMLPLPLANERRPCVLIGRDTMALPASLVSQIGYRCHPALYTEGDPGEKVELVAGSGVYMTRGQLMNCHLCAGVKHKVLLRRLLATFFDRNTLANSCGTGILYCQNFAPNFKESEMNVIAADMCTNARRVRKRWLPKIQSLLPDGLPTPSPQPRKGKRGGGAGGGGGGAQREASPAPFELDLRQLSTSYLEMETPLYPAPPRERERGEAEREREREIDRVREREREREVALLPHLQYAGCGMGTEEGGPSGESAVPRETEPSAEPAQPAGASDPSPPPPGDPAPSHRGLADQGDGGADLLQDSQ